MTIRELELELKQLERIRMRVDRERKRAKFPHTAHLDELLHYIDKWIEHTLRHGEEIRLQSNSKATDSIDRVLGGFIRKYITPIIVAFGIESYTQTRKARCEEQDAILRSLRELAPRIRDYVEHLNLPSGHPLLKSLPQPRASEITDNLMPITEASRAINIEMRGPVPPAIETSRETKVEIIDIASSRTETSAAAISQMAGHVPSPANLSAGVNAEIVDNVTHVTQATRAATSQMPSDLTAARGTSAALGCEKIEAIRRHKGMTRGNWSMALDDCLDHLGGDVDYRTAANWLNFNKRAEVTRFFNCLGEPGPNKRGIVVKLKNRWAQTSLITLLEGDKEVKERFHHQLNKAKKRFESKQLYFAAKALGRHENAPAVLDH